MKNKFVIYAGSAALLVIGFILGSFLYKHFEQKKLNFVASENNEIFVRDYSPRMGNKEAKVFLIEFLDPECESCRLFYPQVKSLLKEFEGKVQLVVRYAPFHGNSKLVIRALEAARMQGEYWKALEMLFHYQPSWGDHHNPRPELIFTYLENLGLDMEKLKADMESPKIEEIINQDLNDLRTLNVRGTPSFFVNGKPLQNFGMEPLRDLLKREIELQY